MDRDSHSPNGAVNVQIDLSKDEALVLFELLQRYSKNNALVVEDQSEQRVLWNLECELEKILLDPFRDDYAQRVADARNAVRDDINESPKE